MTNKKINTFLMTIVTVVILLCAFLWYFMFHMSGETVSNDAIRDTSEIYLGEITLQKGNEVQLNLNGLRSQLNSVTQMIEVLNIEEETELQNYLKEMKEANAFDYIAVIDKNGMVMTENKVFPGMSKLKFLADDMEDTYIEFNTSIENKDLIMVVNPVNISVGKTEYIYTMVGLDSRTLSNKLSLNATSNFTTCEVVVDNGEYIIKASESNLGGGSNYLSGIKKKAVFEQDYSYEQIEEHMRDGKPAFSFYKVDGIRYFSSLIPVENTNWYVISTIRYDAVSAGVDSVRKTFTNSSVITVIAVLVLFLFAFVIYLFMNKKQESIMVEKVKAEESSRAKTFFLSQMSHDIRTPMNAIIGFTRMALEETKVEVIYTYLKKTIIASEHLLMLINEVLEMNRIESGRIELDISKCDLHSMIEDLKTVVGKQAEEKNLIFTVDIDVENTYVYCDKLRVNQILQNILGNAVKYTKEGSVHFSIKQKECVDKNFREYEFKVTDTGVGMPPEFQKRAFLPFERAETTTSSGVEGTGLGLSIVKHMVDTMEGEIALESEMDKGTTFTVCLRFRPVEPELIAQMEGEADNSEKTTNIYKKNSELFVGKRILLVEDNEFNREIAEAILSAAGFVVETAENGRVAVDMIKQEKPDYYDVILMDVQMPVMDGYEATKIIRSMNDEKAKLKIVAVTANAFETDRQESINAGMNEHVAKPINIEQLYDVLGKIM